LDLKQVIEEAVRITIPDTRFKKIIIDRRWSQDLPEIWGDHDQLVQVFVNLLLNAADAVSADGRITIETRYDREGERVMILFSDNGRGIPPEALPKVFDPFYTTKDTGNGTGLGLSICRSIIEGMRGKIEVESEVGKGTTFTPTLPIGAKTNLTKHLLVTRHE
jgi:signal transduction histidine kinase